MSYAVAAGARTWLITAPLRQSAGYAIRKSKEQGLWGADRSEYDRLMRWLFRPWRVLIVGA